MRFTYLKNIDAGTLFHKKISYMQLMLIFSSYIAICSHALKIIPYKREKRYLIKEKHLKTHQIDNTLK